MFRRLLAVFRSPCAPQTAHDDAYNEVDEWADGHADQYRDHAPRIWGPELTADARSYSAGCSAYRCNATHTAPIEGAR